MPPHIVRDIVGHSDIGVTMTIYAHAALDEKRAALGRLGMCSAEAVAVKKPGTENGSGLFGWSDVVGRGGVEPPTFRFSGGRSYRLSYLPRTRGGASGGPDGI